jgi:GTP-binding protein HflX
MLSGAHDVFVEDRLFATLDTLTRDVDLGDGTHARVTDTVGFIRKLPHHLVASFRATLEEARDADVLLHVVDASHPDWDGQIRVVDKVLAELELAERPLILVFNKMDVVRNADALVARVSELYPAAVFATTQRMDGLEALKARLRGIERAGRVTARVRVPATDGALLAELYRMGEVMKREQDGSSLDVTVRLESWQVNRLREAGLDVEVGLGSTVNSLRSTRAS